MILVKLRYYFIVSLITLAMVQFYSCESKKGELELIANSGPAAVTCDSTNVKYSVQVKSILSLNCYSCHAATLSTSLGGGIVLDNYAALSFWSTNGVLLDNIMQGPGSNPMPKNAAKLSNCDIAKIRAWINSGSPNN